MSWKRNSLELTKPRVDHTAVFVDNLEDEEKQYLLRSSRALTRKLSYKPEINSWPHHDQIDFLKKSARGREWGIVGDLLHQLLGNEADDPLKELLLLSASDFTDVLCDASKDGEKRVVELLTERDLVEIHSAKFQSCLHIAAEEGHHLVVRQLLKHSKKNQESPRDFYNFVNAKDVNSKKSHTALHHACDKEHLGVVNVLLEDFVMQELNLNIRNEDKDTPLHLAVTRAIESRNLDIVDLICSKGKQKKLLTNKKNKEGKTPYQRVWELGMSATDEEIRDTADLLKNMLLKQKVVNDRREEYYRERDFLQNVATSLLVGATLLVSVTFGAFLQMPKLPPDADFLMPHATSDEIDPTSDLGSRKYWYIRAIDIFRCSNTISFFMSIISIVASIRVMISRRDKAFIENEVSDLERSIRVASISLTLATAVAVVAFVSGGLANIPVAESGWSRVVSRWGMRKYIPLLQSTTLTTSLLGSLFVAPIIVVPLAKDYYFFWQEYRRQMSSFQRLISLLFATALISTVLLLVCMVIFGVGLL